MHQVKKLRFFTVLATVVGLVTLVLAIPLPHHLRCQLVVLPEAMETVYVQESGQLESCEVEPGQQVEPGQVLAKLKNVDLELTLNESAGKIAEKKSERMAAVTGGTAGSPELLERIATIDSELRQLYRMDIEHQMRAKRLEITSSIAGTVMATPYRHPGEQPDTIQKVDALPLLDGNHDNVSAIRGQRFCEVADLSQWHAVIFLNENQIKFARKDQEVKIRLHSQPDDLLETTVQALGETDQSIHREDYEVPEIDPNASRRVPDLVAEMVAAYQLDEIQFYARAPLQQHDQALKIGLSGEARLFTGYRSLGARLWWWINENFRS
jgi:putative peptide zinc metalloprotease protein